MLIVGVGGVTCGGKSTICSRINEMFNRENVETTVLSQDDYYFEEELLPKIAHLNFWNFDSPAAINIDKYLTHIRNISHSGTVKLLLVEGNLLFDFVGVTELCGLRYFVTLNYDECKRRRELRTDYIPPDYVAGYFEQFVWPHYQQQLKQLPFGEKFTRLDGTRPIEQLVSEIAKTVRKALFDNCWTCLLDVNLPLEEVFDFVRHPTCGAIASFSGTTRDNFEGKQVVQLEYEAYKPMATAELKKLAKSVRQKFATIERIAILHRIGVVPIREESVLIAVSAAHRAQVSDAVKFAIDTLKMTVPIWKKEMYADGTSNWKENSQCCSD